MVSTSRCECVKTGRLGADAYNSTISAVPEKKIVVLPCETRFLI